MNDMSADHVVLTAEEIGIDAREEEMGVINVSLITRKRLTIVVMESSDGFTSTGTSAPWPGSRWNPDLDRVRARRRAMETLVRMRTKAAQYHAKREARGEGRTER